MALLKTGSKPITKRKPRRVFKLKSTLDDWKVRKFEHDSKTRPNLQMNEEDDSSLNRGAFKLDVDNETG